MKMTKLLFLAGLALLAGVINLPAALPPSLNIYSTSGTSVNLGTNYALIPPCFLNGGVPTVTFLAIRDFGVTNTLTSYYSTNFQAILSTNSPAYGGIAAMSSTNLVNNTNGFSAGTVCVLYHLSPINWRQACEYVTVAGVQASISSTNANGLVTTNEVLVFNQTPAYTINPGDMIYQETAGATIAAVGASTLPALTWSGVGVTAGDKEKPFLLLLQSTGIGTNLIDGVTAVGY